MGSQESSAGGSAGGSQNNEQENNTCPTLYERWNAANEYVKSFEAAIPLWDPEEHKKTGWGFPEGTFARDSVRAEKYMAPDKARAKLDDIARRDAFCHRKEKRDIGKAGYYVMGSERAKDFRDDIIRIGPSKSQLTHEGDTHML